MASGTAAREEIRPPGRSEARATGALLLAGAGLVALSLILPHPSGGHLVALCATATGMAVAGTAVWFLSSRLPLALTTFFSPAPRSSPAPCSGSPGWRSASTGRSSPGRR